MRKETLRFAALAFLFMLGLGMIGFLYFIVSGGFLHSPDIQTAAQDDGGWIAATILSIREVIGKIVEIVRGAESSTVTSQLAASSPSTVMLDPPPPE